MKYQKIIKLATYVLAGVGLVVLLFGGFRFFRSLLYQVSYRSRGGGYGPMSLNQESGLPSPNRLTIPSPDLNKGGGSGTEGPDMVEEGELTERKVIKNGSLSLLVSKAEETAEEIKNIASSLEGFVSYSRIYEVSEDIKSGTVTIRVPAYRFDEAMDRIKELAVKVENEKESARDVTEEFVDLEARLTNLRAEEEQYLELMERAEDMEDILNIASRLSNVRGRIERIEGRLKYLSDQVDMATIEVKLTSEAEVEVLGIRWRPLYTVKKSFKAMLSGLSSYVNAVIRFAFSLPVIIVWLGSLSLLAFICIRLFLWILGKLRK